MIRILLSLALLLSQCCTVPQSTGAIAASGGGGATSSWVEQCANSTTTTTSPYSCSLPSTVAGNMIVCTVHEHATGAASLSVSDAVNGAYASYPVATNVTNNVEVFYVLSGAGGSISPSFAATNVNRMYMNCGEFHKTSGSFATDGSAGFTSTSTASPTTNTVTTTGSSDVCVTGLADWNATSASVNSPWTSMGDNTDPPNGIFPSGRQVALTAGTYSGAFTLGAAESDWSATIGCFK